MGEVSRDWADEDWVTISALEHFAYCPRQCALIHVDQVFEDNRWTLRGQRVHETVDRAGGIVRKNLRIERALPLWSDRLGVRGRADIVEFESDGAPYPVEYKSGRRPHRSSEIQLCAQALCLEEMFGRPVKQGALFLDRAKARREITFTSALRSITERVVVDTRALLADRRIPDPCADNRCRECSLLDICLPYALVELSTYREGNTDE